MSTPDNVEGEVLRALLRALMPLARTLLQAGITYREFEHLAKGAFVLSAYKQFGLRGRETNTSRVAHMTGLTRKDVKRTRETFESVAGSGPGWQGIDRPGDVLHGWYSDPEFLTDGGAPKKLDSGKSFERLVKKYAGDVPAGAVKAELKRVGALIEHEDGTIEPLKSHYVPTAALDKLKTSLDFTLFGLLSNIAHNSNPGREGHGHLQRFASSDLIPISRLDAVQRELRREGEDFAHRIDKILATFEDPDSQGSKTTKRNVGMGVFYYEEAPNE